jgi:ferredoxin
MDEDTCMVDVARYFLEFTQKESCGKCVPCRLGTKQMLDILVNITEGEGREEDLNLLVQLGESVKVASLCGLGQGAPNPILTTINSFKDEYQAHIMNKTCPALNCKNLIAYMVSPEKCTGCMLCLNSCPTGAITGQKQEPHTIDQEKCIKCGTCFEACKLKSDSIEKVQKSELVNKTT